VSGVQTKSRSRDSWLRRLDILTNIVIVGSGHQIMSGVFLESSRLAYSRITCPYWRSLAMLRIVVAPINMASRSILWIP